jgi:SpoVK/Ycf46/Vps4 family AAA+-type ATPase
MKITLSDTDLAKCVEASEGLTGADIKELCLQLQRATIDEVFERAKEIDHLREKYSGEEDEILGKSSIIKALGLGRSWNKTSSPWE